MNKIYRYTNYQSNPYGNGAHKRTAQISELLDTNGIEWQIIPSGFNPGSFSFYYFNKCIKTIVYFIRVLFIIRRVCHPRSMYRSIWSVTHFKGVFGVPKTKTDQVILWESTKMDFSFVVPLFRKKGYSIIAVPHNIESLVPSQKSAITNRISPKWIMEEIRVLKKCNQVFTISGEDSIFLSKYGINAKYLPYYPPDNICENLLRIRKIREQQIGITKNRKNILLLGSAINPPTKEGMTDRINFFNRQVHSIFDIIVAGYGTEQLKQLHSNNNNIRFYGELTNEQLIETLIETDMLLVHQPATSGALTRIIESLIAGIPVLANVAGARNYYETDGIYVYNEDEQMINYLSENLPMPLIPEKPVTEYESFLKAVKNSSVKFSL